MIKPFNEISQGADDSIQQQSPHCLHGVATGRSQLSKSYTDTINSHTSAEMTAYEKAAERWVGMGGLVVDLFGVHVIFLSLPFLFLFPNPITDARPSLMGMGIQPGGLTSSEMERLLL